MLFRWAYDLSDKDKAGRKQQHRTERKSGDTVHFILSLYGLCFALNAEAL